MHFSVSRQGQIILYAFGVKCGVSIAPSNTLSISFRSSSIIFYFAFDDFDPSLLLLFLLLVKKNER